MLRARVTAPKPSGVVRRWRFLLPLLRALAVVLGLQLGGIGHAAFDLMESAACVTSAEHERCPPDGPCNDCPPGCPSCHCSNRVPSVAADPSALPPPAETPALDAWHRLDDGRAPAGPERSPLYRPPRTSSLLS